MQPGAVELHTNAISDWSSAATSAAELPLDSIASIRYSESRLAAHRAQVDSLLAIHRSAAVLACQRTAAQIARHPIGAESWGKILGLFESWADGRSLTSVRVPTVWLEFDDVSSETCFSVPSVSVCITPSYCATDAHQPQDERDLQVTQEALRLLGVEWTEREPDCLSHVFAELPSDARWIHVSYMLGRSPRAVKLYGVLRRAELLDYLMRIGWAGDRSAIERALEQLYPAELLGDQLFVDLNLNDFRDRARCTLGLAISQQHLRFGVDPDPTRARVLQAWMTAGLCDPGKAESARAWPASASRMPPRPFERETRFLDLKLIWTAGSGFAAKAYAGQQRFRGLF
jgi:hypothetical protein